jgi:hypothetical protein
MDNHYHLMNETLDANLSVGMRQLNSLYTQTLTAATPAQNQFDLRP